MYRGARQLEQQPWQKRAPENMMFLFLANDFSWGARARIWSRAPDANPHIEFACPKNDSADGHLLSWGYGW